MRKWSIGDTTVITSDFPVDSVPVIFFLNFFKVAIIQYSYNIIIYNVDLKNFT